MLLREQDAEWLNVMLGQGTRVLVCQVSVSPWAGLCLTYLLHLEVKTAVSLNSGLR